MSTVHPPPAAHLGSSDRDERRPQAAPLPLKRGEIGFVEGFHMITSRHEDECAEMSSSLPARHPADRDYRSPSPFSPSIGEARTVVASASRSPTITKALFGRLKPKRIPSIGGLQFTTLLLFTGQLIALGSTAALWAVATKRMKASLASQQYQNPVGSLTVFVHVLFVTVIIGQLVFLERRIYRLRRERYHHLHGDILPHHRRFPSSPDSIISAAPWNRPPLPTYATVLAQTGVGTGDVDDNLIAIPPPPAYGNVRESTLLYSAR